MKMEKVLPATTFELRQYTEIDAIRYYRKIGYEH